MAGTVKHSVKDSCEVSTSLTIGSAVTTTASVRGTPLSAVLENFVANSRLDCWSNSNSVIQAATDAPSIVLNGDFTDNTGWWSTTDCTIASVGGQCVMTRTGGATQKISQLVSVTAGVGYLLSVSLQSGTAGAVPVQVTVSYGGASTIQFKPVTTTGSLTATTLYFIAEAAKSVYIIVEKMDATDGTTIIDSISCVLAGAVISSEDEIALDGWLKYPSTSNVPVIYQDAYTVPVESRGIHSVRVETTAASRLYNRNHNTIKWRRQWQGKAVVFGAWVKAGDNKASIYILDGDEWNMSVANNVGTDWQFLYCTKNILSAAESVQFGFSVAADATAYFSMPIFRRGTSLASTDHSFVRNERIYLETSPYILNGSSLVSGVSSLTLADWVYGSLPPSIKALGGVISGQNTAADKSLTVSENMFSSTIGELYSQVANVSVSSRFEGPIQHGYELLGGVGGKIYFTAEDGNWSQVVMRVNWVEVD
jgi:hypothetical protein